MLARQTPGGESRPVPIGSRLIGVSLRPAIPRRVAPQQSPPPLHQSATIVAEPATPIKCEARPHRCHLGCHLYFARRVTFLSCADIARSSEALAIGLHPVYCLGSEAALRQSCARKRGPTDENIRSLRAGLASLLGAFDQPEKR